MEFYAGEPIIGFRSWALNANRAVLSARMVISDWEVGNPTEATCVASPFRRKLAGWQHEHDVPSDLCSCGLWAYYEPEPLNIEDFKGLTMKAEINDRMVFGTIVAWGRIIFAETGFKAQYALPIAVTDHYTLRVKKWRDTFHDTAREYELAVLPEHKLLKYTRKFGIEASQYL